MASSDAGPPWAWRYASYIASARLPSLPPHRFQNVVVPGFVGAPATPAATGEPQPAVRPTAPTPSAAPASPRSRRRDIVNGATTLSHLFPIRPAGFPLRPRFNSPGLDGDDDARDQGEAQDEVAHDPAVEPVVHEPAQQRPDDHRGQEEERHSELIVADAAGD